MNKLATIYNLKQNKIINKLNMITRSEDVSNVQFVDVVSSKFNSVLNSCIKFDFESDCIKPYLHISAVRVT